MAEGIRRFLISVGLERHFDMFVTRGFDEEIDIPHLSTTDLNCVGIYDSTEVVKILKAAVNYKVSKEHGVLCWLRENGLAHYWEGFQQSQLTDLSQITQLNLPDEDLYDELEITLPGHKRRLERAVCTLRKRQRQATFETEVVTEGWWGYPEYLPNAKYPFLCIQAAIQSTRQNAGPSHCMDFMVDSGSDVCTLRDVIIRDLQLEPLGTVNSCGVYGSQKTTMYRALLMLGESQFEIEVISSSYDSLGSRVMRYFKHRIDSSRHIWFKGSRPIPPTIATETAPQQPLFQPQPLSSPQQPLSTAVSNTQHETVSALSSAGAGETVFACGATISADVSAQNDVLNETGDANDEGDSFYDAVPRSWPAHQLDHGYFSSEVWSNTSSGQRRDVGSAATESLRRGIKRNKSGHVTGAHLGSPFSATVPSTQWSGGRSGAKGVSVNTPRYTRAQQNTDIPKTTSSNGHSGKAAGSTKNLVSVPATGEYGHVICHDDVVRITFSASSDDTSSYSLNQTTGRRSPRNRERSGDAQNIRRNSREKK